MHRYQHNGLAYYTFSSLTRFPELVQAVTTRHGGVSQEAYASLNLSTGLGDDPAAVSENLDRVCAALGVERERLVSPNQRHTANVRRVDEGDCGQVLAGYDILVTDRPDVNLLLRFADCTPVFVYDPRQCALALAHSGWRGTIQGAARAAVKALREEYGSRPGDMVAAIGPSIGPCCYEVGDEVVDAVRRTFDRPESLLPVTPSGRRHFNLWAANWRWLTEAGVEEIEVSEICTACHQDDFYSYRASGGKTGHFAALLGMRAS